MFCATDDISICEFTDLDAYYVGLRDYCKDVEDWGLTESLYIKKKKSVIERIENLF